MNLSICSFIYLSICPIKQTLLVPLSFHPFIHQPSIHLPIICHPSIIFPLHPCFCFPIINKWHPFFSLLKAETETSFFLPLSLSLSPLILHSNYFSSPPICPLFFKSTLVLAFFNSLLIQILLSCYFSFIALKVIYNYDF